MTNATGLRFDAHPWEFALNATEAQRAAQSAHRRMLAEGGAFSAGEGGYVSPKAHVLGRRIALGENNLVAANVRLDGDLVTGRNCSFNLNSTAAGQVRLGDNVRLAAGAGLWGFDHAHSDPDRPISSQGIVSKGITVGDDVWIGTNAVITDGVTIGSHVVIAAGAIVTRDVPDYAVAAGNPARVIRDRRAPRPGRNEASDTLLRLSDMAESGWQNILEAYKSEDRPGYIYSDPRNNSDDPIRPDCDAIQIAAMFDDVPKGASSDEWVDRLQCRQDAASGLFMRKPEDGAPDISGRDPTNSHYYDTLCVGYALECLGAAPKSRVAWADGVLSDLPAWLNTLPWREHGWHCGAMIDTLGTAVYLNHRYFGGQPELPNLVGELTLRASPDSGMWSPPAGDDWLQPVNGFYRLTRGTFAQFGLPVPYPQQVIDTVIAHAEKYRYFRNDTWTACNVLDVVHPLLLCATQTEYRSDEIDRVFAQFATEILKTWQDGAGFAFKPGEPAGLQGTEMWLSVAALIARRLGVSDRLSFRLKGIHRFEPGLVSHRMQ